MLTVPTTAVALAGGQADAQSAVQIDVSRDHVGFDKRLTVTGSAPSGNAGKSIVLEYARAGSARWQTLGSATVAANNRFRFGARLRKSGSLRALIAPDGSPSGGTVVGAVTGSPTAAPSASQPVTVASEFHLPHRSIDVLEGDAVDLKGRLLPGAGGRSVRLEGRSRGAWRVLGAARTDSHGRFRVRYRPRQAGGAAGEPLRVEFRGDHLNTQSTRPAGKLTMFRESLASWYNDGGSTACGFHAGFGVANRTLPCGTRVTFRYRGRSVTAVVDDRGPYVGGREWDLNQNTAGALGFGGVGTVWSTS